MNQRIKQMKQIQKLAVIGVAAHVGAAEDVDALARALYDGAPIAAPGEGTLADGMDRVIERALADAGLSRGDVDVIVAGEAASPTVFEAISDVGRMVFRRRWSLSPETRPARAPSCSAIWPRPRRDPSASTLCWTALRWPKIAPVCRRLSPRPAAARWLRPMSRRRPSVIWRCAGRPRCRMGWRAPIAPRPQT